MEDMKLGDKIRYTMGCSTETEDEECEECPITEDGKVLHPAVGRVATVVKVGKDTFDVLFDGEDGQSNGFLQPSCYGPAAIVWSRVITEPTEEMPPQVSPLDYAKYWSHAANREEPHC